MRLVYVSNRFAVGACSCQQQQDKIDDTFGTNKIAQVIKS